MTLADSSHVISRLGLCVALSIGSFILFVDANPVAAFCVENGTQTRLLFTARLKGNADKGLIYRQWVEGGGRSCGTPKRGPEILEVFVFADEDSIEGCDDEIAADGTLHLRNFEEFDNCVWSK